MNRPGKVSSLVQFIPQLTYDLIARILPGILLAGVASFLWAEEMALLFPSSLSERGFWDWRNFPAIVLAAYFGAQILESLWYRYIDDWMGKTLYPEDESDVKGDVLRDLHGVRVPGMSTFSSVDFPGLPFIYDTVRLKNPVAGARIVKLRAEVQMYRTAFLGLLILTLAYSITSSMSWNWSAYSFSILLSMALFCAILFAQARYRRKRLVWSLYNHWLLLVDPRFSGILSP